jgi:hypothetical protein
VAGQSSWLVRALQYSALPDPSLEARLASTSVLRAFQLESRADVCTVRKRATCLVTGNCTFGHLLTAWNKSPLERCLSTQTILTVTKVHPTPISHHVPLSSVTFSPRLGLPFSCANQNSLCIACLHCVRKIFNHLFFQFVTNDIDERCLRKIILFEGLRLEGIFESKKNAISYLFLVYLTTFSKCVSYIASYMKLSLWLPIRVCSYDECLTLSWLHWDLQLFGNIFEMHI